MSTEALLSTLPFLSLKTTGLRWKIGSSGFIPDLSWTHWRAACRRASLMESLFFLSITTSIHFAEFSMVELHTELDSRPGRLDTKLSRKLQPGRLHWLQS